MDKEGVCVWVCVMEYYLAIKNETTSFAATLINPEISILTEVKEIYHRIPPICGI